MELLPQLVVFHLTNKCNLRCKHCYASAGKQLPKELSIEQVKKIIDELDDLGILYLILSGGEPLLRENFLKIAEYATGKDFNVMITSNGTQLTKETCQSLKEIGVKSIQISVDSPMPKINDEFRGVPGALESALNGVKICSEVGMPCSIMSTLSKLNYNDLDQFVSIAKKAGANSFAFERFVPTGRGKNIKSLELSKEELKKSILYFSEKKKKLSSQLRLSTTEPLFIFTDRKLLNMSMSLNCIGGCSAGISACTITPEGYMTPCTRLFLKLGNVGKRGFEKVWKSSKVLNNLRDRKNLKGKCGSCSYKLICGGCRASAYQHFGDYLQEDPLCWIPEG